MSVQAPSLSKPMEGSFLVFLSFSSFIPGSVCAINSHKQAGRPVLKLRLEQVIQQRLRLVEEEQRMSNCLARQKSEPETQLLKTLHLDYMQNPKLELANTVNLFIAFQSEYHSLSSKVKTSESVSSQSTEVLVFAQRKLLTELMTLQKKLSSLSRSVHLMNPVEGMEAILMKEQGNIELMRYILNCRRNKERDFEEIRTSKMLRTSVNTVTYNPPLRSISENHFIVQVTCNEYDYKHFAAVTVQGEGVHVLEISNMRPVISHTLEPDTHFNCPSIVQLNSGGVCSIYAVTKRPRTISRGPEYSLWKWTDWLSSNSAQVPEKKSSPDFIEDIHRIYSPSNLPTKLVALSVSGHIYVLSTDTMNIDKFIRQTTSNGILIRSFNFPPESCSFASRFSNSDGTLIIRFIMTNKTLISKISLLSSSGIKEIASNHLCTGEEIIDITCSLSGHITVMTDHGTWRVFRLNEQGHITKETSSVHHFDIKSITPNYRGFALTSITSSFVLLACIEGPSNLHFALWDLRFSVVLAEQKFCLPSSLTTGPKTDFQMKLVVATQAEIIVLVSPFKQSEPLSSSRSAVFVLPVAIPRSSSIALAMGKVSNVPSWLHLTNAPSFREEETRQDLLNRIQEAMNNRLPHEADKLFFTWVEEQRAKIKAKDSVNTGRPDKPDKSGGRLASKATKQYASPKFSYRFMAKLLHIILQPANTSDTPYSPKILVYLIERKAVSDNMVQGGLVFTLRRKGDWESICAALGSIGDIPEQQIINLLVKVLENHKRDLRTEGAEDAMDVEPTKGSIPLLVDFLPMVLQYQMSSTAACYVLKTTLSNVDDVVLILQELDRILEEVLKRDFIDSIVDLPRLPSLQSILSFTQFILDAHFLTLIRHLPAQTILRQISGRLQSSITSLGDFSRLQGPLDGVLQAQKSARVVGQRENKRDKTKNTLNTVVGMYQVEELVL